MAYETWTEERAAHFERMASAGMGYAEIARRNCGSQSAPRAALRRPLAAGASRP